MITISFLNDNGGGFARDLRIMDGSTVEGVVNRQLGTCVGFTIRVNGEPVSRNYILRDGDALEAVRSTETAQQTQAPDEIRVSFVNNDGGGFADYVGVATGTTIEEFVEDMLPGVNPAQRRITVNGQVVRAQTVLRNGDRISVTPLKIEGGADISILLVRNDGAGRVNRVSIPENTTVGELFAREVGRGANPDSYIIRVNSAPAHADEPLRANDKVSITPSKVRGG